ncbi:MAG: sodium:solute symporter family protein [Halanaerobiales bacterium]
MPAIYVYTAVAIYIVAGCAVAFAARAGLKKGVIEYFLGGRKIGGVGAALSYSATTYSAFMMVGLAGYTYSGGVGALGFEFVYLAGLVLVAFFGPRFWLVGKKYGYVSPYEMLADRYGNRWIAVFSSAAACVFLIPYLSVQLMGVGYLVSGVSGDSIPFYFGVLLAGVLAIAWVLIAGLRSVVWTDSLQSLIMIVVSLAILLYIVYNHLGGFLGFFHTLESDYSEYLAVPGPGFFDFKTFLGLTLPWFFFSISNPQVSQRLFIPDSLKSMKTMVKGFLIFGFIYTLVSILWGFSALVLIPGLENSDMATPTLLGSSYVPTVLGLIAMIGIMAAAVSTVDSIMLTLSSLVVRDLYDNFSKNGRQMVVARIVIILIALIGLWFAGLQLDLIATLSVASSVGLLVAVPMIFGAFFWRRGTASGALASIFAGAVTAVLLEFSGWKPFGHWAGVWTLLVSTVTFVLISLLTSPPREKAEEFLGYLDQELEEKGIL